MNCASFYGYFDQFHNLRIGKNFQQYDFSPASAPYFKCTFALSTNAEKTTVTYGKTYGEEAIGGPSFVVHCPSPVSITKKTIFQLSLEWVGHEDAIEIPFKGAEKQDLLTFDMTWSALFTAENTNVIVDVDGLDLDESYTCKFTQADNDQITKSADGAFIANAKGERMNCGAQPTGFAISGTTAAVVFELFIKGTLCFILKRIIIRFLVHSHRGCDAFLFCHFIVRIRISYINI